MCAKNIRILCSILLREYVVCFNNCKRKYFAYENTRKINWQLICKICDDINGTRVDLFRLKTGNFEAVQIYLCILMNDEESKISNSWNFCFLFLNVICKLNPLRDKRPLIAPFFKRHTSRHTLAKLERKLRSNFIPFTRLVQLKLNSMRIAMFWLTIRTILTLQKTSSSIRLFLVRVSITRANKQKIERRHSVYPAFIFKSRQFWANFFPKMFTSNLFPASIFPCYHTRFFRIHLNTHIIFIDPYTIFVLLSWKKPSICAFRLQNIYKLRLRRRKKM